jgi:hypothetical protein
MDPRDLDHIKRIIEAQAEGQVPFAWVAVVCGALVSVIGILWAWGFRQSEAWVAKIEELAKDQRSRDDEREATIRERFEGVIIQLNKDHRSHIETHEKRIERLEAAKDLARDQYDSYRVEIELWTRAQLFELTNALDEAGKLGEATLSQLERISREP